MLVHAKKPKLPAPGMSYWSDATLGKYQTTRKNTHQILITVIISALVTMVVIDQ